MRAKVEEAVTAAVAEERAKNSESLEQARKDLAEQRVNAVELSKLSEKYQTLEEEMRKLREAKVMLFFPFSADTV